MTDERPQQPEGEVDGDETLLFRPPFIEDEDEVETDTLPFDDETALMPEPSAETAPVAVVPVSVPEPEWAEPPLVVEPPAEPAIDFWTLLLRPKHAAALRIDGLGQAIERSPNVPANYVLRGELYLTLKRYADAEMDFRRALDLAAAQVESQDWGVVAQVMQDRALAGLKQSRARQ